MRRSIAAYLADIIDACEHIIEATGDLEVAGYVNDKTVRRAVERDFQIIGEGLIQLRDREEAVFKQIADATKIIGFRHILVHQYFDLDHRTVWDTITHDIRPLLALTISLLSALGQPLDE